MDRTEASDAFDAGSIPVGCILLKKKAYRDIGKAGNFKLNKNNKLKEKWSTFLDWIKDFRILIKENKKITIIVIAFVLIVAGAIILSNVLGKNSRTKDAVSMAESESSEEETIVVPEEPLEEDAYPEIVALFKNYYQALADGDVDTVERIKSVVDEKERIFIQKKSEYVESYPTVICYTKKGPVADSFIVMPYYEVKLKDFDTLVPSLNAFYVCRNENGDYYINDDEQDETILNYCKAISVQDDVVDLSNSVQVKYNDLKTEDEELSKFLDELPDLLTAQVGEELAKLEASTQESEEETTTEEETTQEETAEETTVTKKVRTTDVVNVRSSDSETADKLGKTEIGEEFTLLEEKGNGWSKIEYEGKEAFIKSDYLEVVSEETVENDDSDDADNSADTSADATNSPTEGTATVTTTVNVRKSASETAERLGVCYQGDQLEIIMKQADGWTKVKYKSKTGYVKSEFLE